MTPDIGTFTLRRGEASFGPYTAAEIAAYLAAGNIAAEDAIFDHDTQAWTTAGALIASHSNEPTDPNAGTPTPPPVPSAPPTIPGVTTPLATEGGSNGMAVASLVLGGMSLVGCGLVTGIIAIVLGARPYASASDAKLARIGMILGIIGTSLSALGTCGWLAFGLFS